MASTSNCIRIGTRASKLALIQVEEVKTLLTSHFPKLAIEIIPITTSGDKIQDRNLAEIGGKGLFIKELEEALIQNKIDIAVHSAKDVPPILHKSTIIAAFTKRLDARDCFISKKYNSINELPQGALLGTSSARRKAILLSLRPDLKIVNLRGNVDSRLKKISANEVDASILALCGLTRLAKKDEIKEIIDVKKMLPAGGQGALALQTRADDETSINIAQKINDETSMICVKTERSFLRKLNASCVTPVAAYAELAGNKLNLKTIILDYDGSDSFATNMQADFTLDDGIALGVRAAEETIAKAKNLLAKII